MPTELFVEENHFLQFYTYLLQAKDKVISSERVKMKKKYELEKTNLFEKKNIKRFKERHS